MDVTAKRGTKRKRYEPPKEDTNVKIGGKLHHDLKEVRKAAKKAKVFETQKLVKKLKGLRKKEGNFKDIAGLEAQLEALKAIDHEAIANTALKTKLNKDRILSENEHIQAAISEELASNLLVLAIPGSSSAKIQCRLLSSKVLATEVDAAVEDLRHVLQPKPDPTSIQEDIGPEVPKKLKNIMQTKIIDGDLQQAPSNDHEKTGLLVEERGEAEWESGSVGDDESVDEGWESGSLSGELDGSGGDNPPEDSDDDNEDLRVGPVASSPRKKILPSSRPALPKVQLKTPGTRSTFIPSLSVGFIRGGSDDSDWSESEAKIADIDQKKNRRGQRARRAIWEKKYGRNANHKKNESEHREVSRGKPERRRDRNGAFTSNRSRDGGPRVNNDAPSTVFKQVKVPQHHQKVDSGWSQRETSQNKFTPPATTVVPQRESSQQRPLHPSWEAKRKLKQKESAGIVPSQGKKIKFS